MGYGVVVLRPSEALSSTGGNFFSHWTHQLSKAGTTLWDLDHFPNQSWKKVGESCQISYNLAISSAFQRLSSMEGSNLSIQKGEPFWVWGYGQINTSIVLLCLPIRRSNFRKKKDHSSHRCLTIVLFFACVNKNEIYLNQKRPSQTHVSKPNVYPFCLRSCSDEWRASVKHAFPTKD